MSQGEVERRTGLLRSYVSRVENSYTVPSLGTLRKWAKAFELELYQLFFVGKGRSKALGAGERGASQPLSPEDQPLLKGFNRMTKPKRRPVLDMARKMAAMEKG